MPLVNILYHDPGTGCQMFTTADVSIASDVWKIIARRHPDAQFLLTTVLFQGKSYHRDQLIIGLFEGNQQEQAHPVHTLFASYVLKLTPMAAQHWDLADGLQHLINHACKIVATALSGERTVACNFQTWTETEQSAYLGILQTK